MDWRILDLLPFGKSYFFLCRQIVENFSIQIVLLPPILVVAFIYVVQKDISTWIAIPKKIISYFNYERLLCSSIINVSRHKQEAVKENLKVIFALMNETGFTKEFFFSNESFTFVIKIVVYYTENFVKSSENCLASSAASKSSPKSLSGTSSFESLDFKRNRLRERRWR